jgi:hypothetical protein
MTLRRVLGTITTIACAGFVLNLLVVVTLSIFVNVLADPPLARFMRVGERVAWAVTREAFGSRVWELRYEARAAEPNVGPHVAPSWLDPDVPSAENLESNGPHNVICYARGWPRLCAWLELRTGAQPTSFTHADGGLITPWLALWSDPAGTTHARAVPLRPIWTGVVINTACFGLVAWFVLFLVRGQWRLRRFYRGACPMCGYMMLGQYGRPCPECGAHIAKHKG